ELVALVPARAGAFVRLGGHGVAIGHAQLAGGGPRRRARDGAGTRSRAAAVVGGGDGGGGGTSEVRQSRVRLVRGGTHRLVVCGLALAFRIETSRARVGVQRARRAVGNRERRQLGGRQ